MSFLKNLFLFFSLFILSIMEAGAQPNAKKYNAAWKQVEQHIEKGLPQSALEEVRKIYAWAKTEKADAQLIKATWYIGSLQEQTREDNDLHMIAEIEKELSTAKEPITSLLENMLAGLYLNYFEKNRWNLYNRTETTGFNKNDIATWSAGDFHQKITDLYLKSLQPEKLLQSVKLNAFDPVIVKGNMRHLRPTLYDLLAHNALSYFENDERDIQRPAYAFEINMADAFAPAKEFIQVKFTTADSASLKHKALETWQKLISFHIKDANPSALIDADLARLVFVRNNSTHADKDNLYFHAVKQVTEKYGQLPAAAQAWYLLALWHEEKAGTYKPYGDSTHRLARVKAKEILEKIAQQKDSSEGKILAMQLLERINTTQLNFQVEQVNIPNTPFRSLFTYQNLNRVYLRLVKVSDEMREDLRNQYGEKFWSTTLSAPVMKTWEQALPGSDDMQTHSAEIKIDGLPPGDYMLIGSASKDFIPGRSALGAGRFYVSGISYVHMNENYFVLDRDNGKPLTGAEVQVWEQYYDYKLSKQVKKAVKKYTTDKNGWFRMEYAEKEKNSYSTAYSFDIRHKDDRLFIDRTEYVYYDYRNSNEEPKVKNKVFLFLDRAIYRPGQTVFFKGIVLRSDPQNKTNSVEAGYESTIVLANANGTEVDTIKLKANEFGSFSGKFQLPASGLNGYFRMFTREGNGETGFRVEEYKRPKFYVDFEPVKGTYRVGDTVHVDGYAKAYAGNNIDGAQVKYRVTRRARFPYPWFYKRGWFPPVQAMEITNGTATTDKDGKFSISFAAIPDRSIDPKMEPVFDYVVSADITDINGETRSGEKIISAGYKSLLIKSTIPETTSTDSLRKVSIRTENMNGDFTPAMVKLVITRLQPELRLVRKRYWERPDQFVMSKEEYVKNFPYDEYDNETDYTTWKKGEIVLEQNDSTRSDGSWLLNGKTFSPGTYLVEISTTDKDGAPVKDQRYIELYKQSTSELPRPVYLWTGDNTTTVEPGEKALINWGTTAKDIHVIHHSTRMNWRGKDKIAFDYTSINNEKKSYTIPVDEKDRGGFGTGWMFIKNNRVYQVNETISIPWTNKELDIEYMTFRDKTLPGSEEKWKVRITGYKKEMVAAEMLASMYDASLDQFVSHFWDTPSVWPTFSLSGITWDGSVNFSNSQSSQHSVESRNSYVLDKRYDRLFWNNADYVAYETIRGGFPGKVSELRLAAAAPKSMEYANANIDANGVADEMDYKDVGNQQQQAVTTEGAIIRKNFNETAFFFPDLHTDSTGAIEFSFTIPEALTKWKFMALAHTKDAAFGNSTKEIVTQKELMVQPNPPRFLREGDKMEFTSKIVNLSTNELTGTVEFRLFDAETMEPVDGAFRSVVANQYFTVAAGQSEVVRFPMEVPYLFNRALLWRVVAKAGNYSDGEENVLPVLTNRMLVTETLPLHMNGAGTQVFDFTKLLSSGNSETLKHHALTIEYAGNPAWFAIQALPYLDNYPYECAEQTWNRYFANSLAAHIAGSSPKIRAIFEKWRITDTAALMSNLQKNQELKAVLLEETPWVLDAKTETEQKRNIALLFDMVRMTDQLNKSYEKLKEMQSPNGGFVWFKGGPDDRYITQYIVSGIGHLRKLGGILPGQEAKLNDILNKAIAYLDRKVQEDYDQLVKNKTDLKKYTPGYYTLQSLYARSFFAEEKIPTASQKAYDYFMERVRQTWTSQGKYMQGMSALALNRKGDSKTANAILKSLKETSIVNPEMGRYWKDMRAGWFWHEAPIETQALLIEAFQEIAKDTKTVDELRIWLLKNKQTNNWNTTKATAEACYALLLQGTDWLSAEPRVMITLGEGNRAITIPSATTTETGTGYFKQTISSEDVLTEMGKIKVNVTAGNEGKAPAASWGGAYWQYFEDLDKITNAETPLKLVKKLFVERNTDRGPVLTPINDGDAIKTGDKIKVRIELRVDRDMEYVHMKDMRASAFEPVNVLSGYKWQGGLGYYETTKDASTNFFFNSLRKGTYVFEYSLFATHSGEFSNGITTIQSMYAPEFSSHSEGVRVQIEN